MSSCSLQLLLERHGPAGCVGASIVASPLIALSLLAPEYQQSFAALLIGFALSETWRAPAAVLVRDVSPFELGATGNLPASLDLICWTVTASTLVCCHTVPIRSCTNCSAV